MKILRVIESKVWQHKVSKRQVSIYGAHPASHMPGDTRENWEVVTRGFTWEVKDAQGRITVGLGRKPMATREAAERYMEEFNKK